MPRFPNTISLRRFKETPRRLAASSGPIPIGFRDSSSSISPGATAGPSQSGSLVIVFVAVVAALRSASRSRIESTAEVFALRHQLAVLRQRAPERLRPGRTDRLVWVLL